MSRRLWRIRVGVLPESEDAVACLLESTLGRPASVYTDVRRGRSWATVYLSKATEWSQARRKELEDRLTNLIALGLPLPSRRVSVARLADEDWAESWKRHFKPLAIGRHLLILPSWSRRRPRRGQVSVVLDPGLSFGTGQHPTTRFCLEELVAARVQAQARSLVDIGCGSGILAIAAARLGYERVDAFDYDAAAVRIAGVNAGHNRVRRRIRLWRQDLTRPAKGKGQQFDVVCANLTSDLLVAEAAALARRVAPGGRLILAGILGTQFRAVRKAFLPLGFRLKRSRSEGEWRSGLFRAGPDSRVSASA